MFLLSRNKLVELVDRSSLFFKASCVENDSNFTYIRIVGEPLIFKITKIMNWQKMCCMQLFDGIDSSICVLDDKTFFPNGSTSISKSNNLNESIESNSIIILHEYSIVNYQDVIESIRDPRIFKNYEASKTSFDQRKIIKIHSLSIIGKDNASKLSQSTSTTDLNPFLSTSTSTTDLGAPDSANVTSLVLSEQLSLITSKQGVTGYDDEACQPKTCEEKNVVMTISNLNEELDVDFVYFEATVVKKNNIKSFQTQSNFSGSYGRLLLRDKEDFIELLAFNNVNHLKIFEDLTPNTTYFFSKLSVKKANKKYQAWPQSNTTNYEVNIVDQTEINISTNKQCYENLTNIDQTLKNDSKTSNPINPIINKSNDKFILIQDICKHQVNSLVSVIGIINDIEDLDDISTKKGELLALKRFTIIDNSSKTAKVALWGEEAKNFKFEIGTVLMLLDVKITNFGGRSFSVLRVSGIIDVSDNDLIPFCVELKEWLRKNSEILIQRPRKKIKII